MRENELTLPPKVNATGVQRFSEGVVMVFVDRLPGTQRTAEKHYGDRLRGYGWNAERGNFVVLEVMEG